MTEPDPTWLVLVRDVSQSIRVPDHSQLTAGMVLDADTGLVRGLAVAPTDAEALAQAFHAALTNSAGPLPPAHPARVLCEPGLADSVAAALGVLTTLTRSPPVSEVEPGLEAQEIFDSFLGHMAGRAQPEDPPDPEEWQFLFDQTRRFFEAEPWVRWSDDIDLVVEVSIAGERARYAAVVMGNAGLQHGLVLYPGEAAPADLGHGQPDGPMPPPGTLMCILDPPAELPGEFTAKAIRYGWPAEADLVPVFVKIAPEGGGDIGSDEVRRFTVAIAAVLAHDSRGPILAHPATSSTSDTVILADGHAASFTISQRLSPDEPALSHVQVHRAGVDLVPVGTPVVLGHLSWPALTALRAEARLHQRPPSDAPVPAGKEVPLVAVLPQGRSGDRMAAKLAGLLPTGVAVFDTDNGEAVLTLVGEDGAEVLMEVAADNSGLAAFRRRLRQTKGRHVVMIADEATAVGQGNVYGLFECHQPLPPAKKTQSRRPTKARSKGDPRR